MKISDLLVQYVNRDTKHKREIGRYWASDIYNIITGRLTPKNYFKKRPIDLQGCRNIISGIAFENMFRAILDELKVPYKYGEEIKHEIKIDDFTLVVKPDFEFEDKVIETKFPVRKHDEIPPWYIYQLEAESRTSKKPLYLGIFETPFWISQRLYKPSDERWEQIKKVLRNFNKQLKYEKEK